MSTQRAPTCGDAGGRTARGEPCGCVLGLKEDPDGRLRCDTHSIDPERRARAADARALGAAEGGRVLGIAKRIARETAQTTEPENLPGFAPDTLERLALWLQWAARAVAVGEISAKTASEVTRACKELRPVLVAVGMEQRLKQLERDLAEAKRKLERER